MAKLTKTYIDNIQPPETGQKLIYDDEMKGFGLRVTKGAKTYICQARVNGKVKRVKIGSHGAWTLDNARKKAREHLVDMANGKDPNMEKKANEAKAITLDEVVKAYIKDRSLKSSSISDMNKHLDGIFKPLKDQPITAITRDKVLKLFRKASGSSKAQANQAFRLLRAWINYAMATYRPGDKPIIIENPVQVLSGAKMWHDIKPKSGKIPTEKVGIAWNAIQKMRSEMAYNKITETLRDAAGFLLLTGCRFGEAKELKWENVNLEEMTWHITDPKNHNPITLPLSSQAMEILKNRPRINEYVFGRKKGKGHITDIRFTLEKVSEAIEKRITPHDMRRTFRAIGEQAGVEFYKIKLLMNHKMNQDVTISAYTETSDLKYLQPDIQKIGDWIERQGVLAKNKVVDINTVKAAQGQAEQVA